jgi:hypothetical protein
MGLGRSPVLRSLSKLKKRVGCYREESRQTRESAREEEGGNREGHCATRKSYYSAGKIVVPRGKVGLKRPSNAEVASSRPIKQTKKAMFCPAAMGTKAGASGSKVVAGTKKLRCLLRHAAFLLLMLWQRRLWPSCRSHHLTVR